MPLNIEIEVKGCEQADIGIEVKGCEQADINVTTQCETLTLEIIDAPIGGGGAVAISMVADNRLEAKPDGLYVSDRLDPEPVAYYLLSRG